MIMRLAIWFSIIIGGFILFIITQIPFQMGLWGGYDGAGLTIIGVLQALMVIPLLYLGLSYLRMSFKKIGLTTKKWKSDSLLGAAVAIGWAMVQFIWIIPSTGGASREDISEVLIMLDSNWENILWYLPLGIIGGGIVEELYNRGFLIGALAGIFNDSKFALYIASVFL
ncbi:hypothetical protein [Thalassobacillus sp. CUG 92003]|uniref:hypothetical protein n=1 Tax=Thalassobacillus sp. CUG 92003 TaxID=2736641 RepID=UPI0015E6C1D5|nr:hypothetical protein [Thalassobacillus sp. CUG 92003]